MPKVHLIYTKPNVGAVVQGYTVVRHIGDGHYGSVHEVKKDGIRYAMKVMRALDLDSNSGNYDTQATIDKMSRLKNVQHPFIIRYYDSFLLDVGPETYIIMEYCAGMNMKSAIRATREQSTTFPEGIIKVWFVQLLMAVSHLHQFRIVHREIKPNNIFIMDKNTRVKLGDFSFVKALNANASMADSSGRREKESYRAPELWQGFQVRLRVDEWSLGCFLYELMRLRPPFCKTDIQKIINSVYDPIPTGQYSQDLVSLVRDLLKADQKIQGFPTECKIPFLQMGKGQRPHALDILDRPILSGARNEVHQMFAAELENIPTPGVPEEPENDGY